MADDTTVVRFIDGPRHGESEEIQGNPQMLRFLTQPRIPHGDPEGRAVGGYLHYQRQPDRKTYRLVTG